MSILITGGKSQTGLAVAKYLKEAGKKAVFATRNGQGPDGFDAVKLDWSDPSTLEAPFANGQTYQGVYLLSPMGLAGVTDVTPNIISFIDIAAARGVSRFVFISGCMVDKKSDFGHAKIHRYLEEKKLDHLVLKPPMFMGEFPFRRMDLMLTPVNPSRQTISSLFGQGVLARRTRSSPLPRTPSFPCSLSTTSDA